MEIIKSLVARLRHAGVPLLAGVILIVYLAFGFVYWQQWVKQREFSELITKLAPVVTRPLPSSEKLLAEYEASNLALAPMTNSDAINILVGIAEEYGIDIDEASGKFTVPPATPGQADVAGGSYQLLSFKGIRVQGDPDKVIAFLSDLDSGKTLERMVLMRMDIDESEVGFWGEEAAKKAEFRKVEFQKVSAAMITMMDDNGLLALPFPMSFAGGVASNLMGDDPATGGTVEGFPDITTTAAAKGYSGNATPRAGYVLYNHDRISTDNTTQFETVSYINALTTEYYYTSEANGTVRQFDGANPDAATEYRSSEGFKDEMTVTVDVDIYMRARE